MKLHVDLSSDFVADRFLYGRPRSKARAYQTRNIFLVRYRHTL